MRCLARFYFPAAFLHTSLISMPGTATQTLDTLCFRPNRQQLPREQPTKGWILQHLDLAAGPWWMCHVPARSPSFSPRQRNCRQDKRTGRCRSFPPPTQAKPLRVEGRCANVTLQDSSAWTSTRLGFAPRRGILNPQAPQTSTPARPD